MAAIEKDFFFTPNNNNFLVSSSQKVDFAFVLYGDLTMTISSTTLKQENFTFSPTQWKFVTKYVNFYRFWLQLSQRFKTCFEILRHFFVMYTTVVGELWV